MAGAKPKRGKNKDNARRSKKKISVLNTEKVTYVDYKDVNLLKRFMSDRAKIRARRVTGNSAQQQSDVAMAIKNAREMALLPYANRVTQQRGRWTRPRRSRRSRAPPRRPAAAANRSSALGRVRGCAGRGRGRQPGHTRRWRPDAGGAPRGRRWRRHQGRGGGRGRRPRPQPPAPHREGRQGHPGGRGPGRGHAPSAGGPRRGRPGRGRGRGQDPRVPATITITAKAGTEGRLFGSVGTGEVAEAVEAQTGISLDRRKLVLDEPIKELGEFQVTARLHPNVEFPVRIEVVGA